MAPSARLGIFVAILIVCLGTLANAKVVYLHCVEGIPVPMNTIVTGDKADKKLAFIAATDHEGLITLPDGNDYQNVKIFAQCMDLITEEDGCAPVFFERIGRTPLKTAVDKSVVALAGSVNEFYASGNCITPSSR